MSLVPIMFLLGALVTCIITTGADSVLDMSPAFLLSAAVICVIITVFFTRRPKKALLLGFLKGARQVIPAYPLLLLIGMLSSTWMLSGVVPYMINVGMGVLNPTVFLPTACIICAVISIVTGSSWTTIATVGVALMGIGTLMDYDHAWIAGAIISGAYFGDKISPLSDTTILASSTVGVKLITHIRSLMITTMPAMILALCGFSVVGFLSQNSSQISDPGLMEALSSTFNLSPWLMLVPLATLLLIMMRVPTLIVMTIASVAGLVVMFIAQPHIVAQLTSINGSDIASALNVTFTSTALSTGNETLDALAATSGMEGMLPTIKLISCAMIFGGVMIGSGMLTTLTSSFIKRLRKPGSMIGATVATGLFLNSCTGDQYISIIIGGNLFRTPYRMGGYKPQVLSRTLEDSISVTSVLIPWNSCGMTQSTVLSVSALSYLPCCLFNLLSPVMSIVVAKVAHKFNYRLYTLKPTV